MAEIFDWLYQVVHQITAAFGYPGIFLMMLVENLLPPIPSEVVMPFAGFSAAHGDLNIAGVLLSGTLGSVVGALIIYEIGKKVGEQRLRSFICRSGKYLLVSTADLERALDTFDRHGKAAIFIGRLIPGVRSLISLPAGVRGMNLPEFLAYTIAGTLAWNILLATAGFILGSNWQQVLEVLSTYERGLWIVIGALLALFLWKRLRHRPQEEGC